MALPVIPRDDVIARDFKPENGNTKFHRNWYGR
jgi:hypothetical protein